MLRATCPPNQQDLNMNLSVVIVSFNTEKMTLECLHSIESQADQIVVVDNASSDGSPSMLTEWAEGNEYRKVILNTENVGFARANNRGFQECTGEVVLLLNSDTLVPKNGLSRLTSWLSEHPDVGACGPRLHYPNGAYQHSPFPAPKVITFIARFMGLKHLLPSAAARRALARRLRFVLGEQLVSYMDPGQKIFGYMEVECLSGAALLVRKNVIDQTGGLDERYFMYLEDVDWCIRIRRAGWRLGFVPDVGILHYAGASFNGDKLNKSFRAAHPESFKSIALYLQTYFGIYSRALVKSVITISLGLRSVMAMPLLFSRRRREALLFIRANLRNVFIVWELVRRS